MAEIEWGLPTPDLRGFVTCPGCKVPMLQSERCTSKGCPCFRMRPRSPEAQAAIERLAGASTRDAGDDVFAADLAELEAELAARQGPREALRELAEAEVRGRAIDVEILHIEGP